MNILFHICCAPCAICALEETRRDGHTVKGLFYNPNIHPYAEYEHRREACADYAAKMYLDVAYGKYEIEKFFQNIAYNETAPKDRCPACWWMRMEETVKFASANSFDAFTTTLLGSPYQDHDTLKKICGDIAARTGVEFYYKDFRILFREAHNKAKSEGVYCQKYCGCLFSERERAEKLKIKKSPARKSITPGQAKLKI